jgi:hypothetical protein
MSLTLERRLDDRFAPALRRARTMLAPACLFAMRVKLNATRPRTENEASSRPLVDFSVGEMRHLVCCFLPVLGLALGPVFA